MGESQESSPRGGPAVLPFALYAVSVSAIEIGAYGFGGLFAVVASRAWLVCGALFLTCSLAKIWSTFRRDLGVAGVIIKLGTLMERVHLSLRTEALALFLLLAVSAGWNLRHSHWAYHDLINRRQYEVLKWSLTVAQEMALIDRPIDMYVFSSVDFSMEDHWRYFFPRLGTLVLSKEQCLQKFTATRISMILYDDSACKEQLQAVMTAHEGFHELPPTYGLKGLVFVPEGERARASTMPFSSS